MTTEKGPDNDTWIGHLAVGHLHKNGRNKNVDATPTDLWDLTTQPIWLAPTASRIHAIVSSSADDDAAGTGARVVRIWGLRDWESPEIFEDVIMDGVTPVNTKNSFVIIHRIRVIDWSTSGPNVGVIKATAATDLTITAQILAGIGATQMVIYGVPSGHELAVSRIYANLNKQAGQTALADVVLLENPIPDSITTGFVVRHTFGLDGGGTSALSVNYGAGRVFEGPTILKLQAEGSVADIDVSGGIDATLYKVIA